MRTWEDLREWAADFEREYPEDLPARLRWFTDQLGIPPYRLLRLMGLPRREAEELAKGPVDWDAVLANTGEESGWWVEASVRRLLADDYYDWRALRNRLHQPADPSFLVPRPGGGAALPEELPPEERETVLLTLLAEGGPSASRALLAYLAPTTDAAGNR